MWDSRYDVKHAKKKLKRCAEKVVPGTEEKAKWLDRTCVANSCFEELNSYVYDCNKEAYVNSVTICDMR